MDGRNRLTINTSGRPIGSALIDHEFHQFICARLDPIQDHLKEEPARTADRMIEGVWERIKCSFGTPAAMTLPAYYLPVPGLPDDSSFPDLNINKSKILLQKCGISSPCKICTDLSQV